MNRRGFLKSIGLASAGVIVAGSITNLVLPSIKKQSKSIFMMGDGSWYDINEMAAMKEWQKEQEKLFWDFVIKGKAISKNKIPLQSLV